MSRNEQNGVHIRYFEFSVKNKYLKFYPQNGVHVCHFEFSVNNRCCISFLRGSDHVVFSLIYLANRNMATLARIVVTSGVFKVTMTSSSAVATSLSLKITWFRFPKNRPPTELFQVVAALHTDCKPPIFWKPKPGDFQWRRRCHSAEWRHRHPGNARCHYDSRQCCHVSVGQVYQGKYRFHCDFQWWARWRNCPVVSTTWSLPFKNGRRRRHFVGQILNIREIPFKIRCNVVFWQKIQNSGCGRHFVNFLNYRKFSLKWGAMSDM